MVGAADEAISRSGLDDIGSLLGAAAQRFPAASAELKGNAGRYVADSAVDSSTRRRIFIDQALDPQQAGRVQAHETGHLIDDLIFGRVGPGGAKLPTKGLTKELHGLYEELNTSGWFKPGRGMTPEGQGYRPDAAEGELVAEAIRAYMTDPNYVKTKAPKVAAAGARNGRGACGGVRQAVTYRSPSPYFSTRQAPHWHRSVSSSPFEHRAE